MPGERITVEIRPAIVSKLKSLVSRTHRNQTEVVNRAIELFEYVDSEQRKGRELIIRDSKGREQTVRFF